MATEKYDGFKVTTKDMDFEPIELTIEITSRKVYDAVVQIVTMADVNADRIVYTINDADDENIDRLVDALFRAIIK